MAYLVGNLSMIRSDIRAKFSPDPTIYWIGDTSHRRRKSDHNPDGYGRVYAIDVMTRVVNAMGKAVVKACVGRSDLSYVIYNRTIWSASYGWRARRYTGSDPHTNHVHISGKHTAAARNNRTHLRWAGGTSSGTTTTKPTTSAPKFPGELKRGSKGAGVKTLQSRLNTRGYTPKLKVDGDYGDATVRNVKAFQKFAKIKQDGIVGPITWGKLWSLKVT